MKLIFLFQLIFLTNTIFAQTNFRNISFAEALRMAKAEGKMVFMQFESENCEQCNEVADKGLEDKEVGRTINEAFVPIKITVKHADRSEMEFKFNMADGFGTLFIDMNGTLMHKFGKSTTLSKEYVNQIGFALYATSESARINDLENEYKNGNRDIAFIEALLTKKKMLNLATDILLDDYVSILPNDSLQSIRTITFIAQLAPMLGSKAYSAMYKDAQLFNKAWYSMSLPLRRSINNLIIDKGIKKAIEEKNEILAMRVASFAKKTNMPNFTAANKAYDRNLLYFYEKTDTSKYLGKAIDYYNSYYMSLNIDSIKTIDSLRLKGLIDQAPKTDTIINGRQVRRAAVSFAPSTQYYEQALNSGAWKFYKMSNDPNKLSIAIEWAKKGLEFYKSPEILDTYSRLLYKQNQKAKAIELQHEAIEVRKQRKFSTKEYDVILAKMVKGETID